MAINVISEPSRIVVELSGAAILGALRRRIEVPSKSISSVSVRPRNEVRWDGAWLRLPGAYIPGVIRYGSYGLGSRREFWAVTRQSEVVVIETSEGTYRRLVLGVGDPHGVAGAITAAIG
jgi:hypothetical protein